MLEILKEGNKPEVAWALEVLKLLPDEAMDRLLQQDQSSEPSRVTHLAWKGGSASCEAFNGGQVVRYLLGMRLSSKDSKLWTQAQPLLGALQALETAWQAYRAPPE